VARVEPKDVVKDVRVKKAATTVEKVAVKVEAKAALRVPSVRTVSVGRVRAVTARARVVMVV
jgi:hypothetical protein